MIDHPDQGPDPLAGRNPHPREQIDLWPLHDARQELLEEIVSQPGAGESAGRTKVLLSVVGIAAALALVVGGAWAITRDGSGGGDRDDQVVAASSDEPAASDPASTEATTGPEAEPTKDPEPDRTPRVRLEVMRIGGVADLDKCLRELRRLGSPELEDLRVRTDARRRKDGRYVVYLAGKDTRFITVDQRCRVVKVGPKERRTR